MKLYGVLTYQTMKKLSSTTQYTKISKKHLNTTKTASFHCNTKTRASNLETKPLPAPFFSASNALGSEDFTEFYQLILGWFEPQSWKVMGNQHHGFKSPKDQGEKCLKVWLWNLGVWGMHSQPFQWHWDFFPLVMCGTVLFFLVLVVLNIGHCHKKH